MTKSVRLRLFLLSIMLLMLMVIPTTSSRAGKIGPLCVQCTWACHYVYQDCMIANSPCDNECQEQCYANQAACQQLNCTDTGICPNN